MGDADQLNNLCFAYHTLHNEVCSALRRMVGDPSQLNAVRDCALALAAAAEQVCLHFAFIVLRFYLHLASSGFPPRYFSDGH
jgi:hypothetical protein